MRKKKRLITLKRLAFLSIAMVMFAGVSISFAPTRDVIISTFNFLRPLSLVGGGQSCLQKLESRGVSFASVAEFSDGSCGIKNPVKISRFSSTELSGAALLSCPTAVIVDNWLVSIEAKKIKHMGTYNCRRQRNNGLMSEHSYGTAIDVAVIDGAILTRDWGKASDHGKTLNNAYKNACKFFSNIITPDDNALHHDHFHLDTGFGVGCFLKPLHQLLKQLY